MAFIALLGHFEHWQLLLYGTAEDPVKPLDPVNRTLSAEQLAGLFDRVTRPDHLVTSTLFLSSNDTVSSLSKTTELLPDVSTSVSTQVPLLVKADEPDDATDGLKPVTVGSTTTGLPSTPRSEHSTEHIVMSATGANASKQHTPIFLTTPTQSISTISITSTTEVTIILLSMTQIRVSISFKVMPYCFIY